MTACCLTTSIHYLNQCWLIDRACCGIHSWVIWQQVYRISIPDMSFKIIDLILQPYLPRVNVLPGHYGTHLFQCISSRLRPYVSKHDYIQQNTLKKWTIRVVTFELARVFIKLFHFLAHYLFRLPRNNFLTSLWAHNCNICSSFNSNEPIKWHVHTFQDTKAARLESPADKHIMEWMPEVKQLLLKHPA